MRSPAPSVGRRPRRDRKPRQALRAEPDHLGAGPPTPGARCPARCSPPCRPRGEADLRMDRADAPEPLRASSGHLVSGAVGWLPVVATSRVAEHQRARERRWVARVRQLQRAHQHLRPFCGPPAAGRAGAVLRQRRLPDRSSCEASTMSARWLSVSRTSRSISSRTASASWRSRAAHTRSRQSPRSEVTRWT